MTTASLTGRRILIVEDEYFIAADLKRALHAADAEVVGPVGDVTAGLDLAKREPLDAAILDVNLEGNFSYALADLLMERNVPYAFVTGYDGWSLPERYRDASRITKPFAAAAVVDLVTELCVGGQRS